MIRDALCRVSLNQAHTTNTTTVSASSYDTGNVTPKNKIGDGEPLELTINVESVTGAADTFTFEIISSTAADLGSNVKGHGRTRVLTAAEIPAGMKVRLPFPAGAIGQGRYIGYRATLGAADALTCSAVIEPRSFADDTEYYASGVLIS